MQRVTVLLALLAACVLSLEQGCEWIGNAPICGSQNCPAGSIEIVRQGEGVSKIAEFGSPCATGQKTLCCNKEVVAGDPKKHCGVWDVIEKISNAVDGKYKENWLHTCSPERVEIVWKKVVEPVDPAYTIDAQFCCDKGFLRV